MNFRYKVKGIVESPFILRGMAYIADNNIDTTIFEKEIEYIKAHCRLFEVVDLATVSKPLPEKNVQKGDKNVLSKPTSRTNKVKNTAKV